MMFHINSNRVMMRKRFCLLAIAVSCLARLPDLCRAQEAPDHVILPTGQRFYYKHTPTLFPTAWRVAPTSARAEALDNAEIGRSLLAVQSTLACYPAPLLARDLYNICMVKYLNWSSVNVGGTIDPTSKTLYITNIGPVTDVAETTHHELAHLLMANHLADFPAAPWKRLNGPLFQYGKGGLESVRDGSADETLSEEWNKRGFVSQYASTAFEEDFAETAQYLFSGNTEFWGTVDKYAILGSKVQLAIDFYHGLDKQFTEDYFRHLPAPPAVSNRPITTHYENGGTYYSAKGKPPAYDSAWGRPDYLSEWGCVCSQPASEIESGNEVAVK